MGTKASVRPNAVRVTAEPNLQGSIRATRGVTVAPKPATGGETAPLLAPAQVEALRAAFDAVVANTNARARRDRDPISFVHAQTNDADRELVALLAAQLAFGNVTTILAKIGEVLRRLSAHGATPTAAMDALEEAELHRLFADFRHRVFVGADVAALLLGGRLLQHRYGSLGAAFLAAWGRKKGARETGEPLARAANALPPIALALADFCDELRLLGKFPPRGEPTRRGASHLLPDVARGAGAKRLFLFLRWMVRPADGIDFGIWDFSPEHLLIPVDTHIHKIARNLGLTERPDASLKTAFEITSALRLLDPKDPVRYDFALCHSMMNQDCQERAVAEICDRCSLRPVCRHHAVALVQIDKATARRPRA